MDGSFDYWTPFLILALAWLGPLSMVLWDVRDRERPRWTRQDKFSFYGILFNLITLLAAVVGVGIAFKAFRETKRQADAAEIQIGVAKDTAKRQLRPYVYVIATGLQKLGPTERPEGGASVHMIGQTPAYELELMTHFATLPFPLVTKIEEVSAPAPPAEITHSILFPGIQFSNTATLGYAPSEQQMNLLKQADQARFFVWGTVTYKDTFSDTHHVHFCFDYDKPAVNGERGPQVCERYNDAD